jgi:hypothetical protein
MDNKPLSHIMSDSSHAVDDALETLGNAIMEAINTHFDAGIQVERESIIKLLESKSECKPISGHDWNGDCYCEIIGLIKGETE